MVKRICCLVLAASSVAAAQPSLMPPLTDDERDSLAVGEISHDRVVGGIVLDGVVGYGLGQALQHRWTETGWIFTLGEGGATVGLFAGMMKSLGDCLTPHGPQGACPTGNNLMLGSAIALTVFRVASMIDAGVGPSRHNARVRALRQRAMPIAAIVPDGAVAGFALRF